MSLNALLCPDLRCIRLFPSSALSSSTWMTGSSVAPCRITSIRNTSARAARALDHQLGSRCFPDQAREFLEAPALRFPGCEASVIATSCSLRKEQCQLGVPVDHVRFMTIEAQRSVRSILSRGGAVAPRPARAAPMSQQGRRTRIEVPDVPVGRPPLYLSPCGPGASRLTGPAVSTIGRQERFRSCSRSTRASANVAVASASRGSGDPYPVSGSRRIKWKRAEASS